MGNQSLSLVGADPIARVRVDLSNTTLTQIGFVDFFLRPIATTTVLAATEQAGIMFLRENDTAVLHYFEGDGQGGGQWKPTGFSRPVDAAGKTIEWIRITFRENYATHRWDLYANGTLITCDIGAPSNNPADLASLTVTGANAGDTGFDGLYAGADNPIFADQDRDGMEDAWETSHGLNSSLNDRDGDPDGDGSINLQEYLLGTDPSSGTHTLIITSAETAGIGGFLPLWNTPVPLAENGATRFVTNPYGNGDGLSAFWIPGTADRPSATTPGGLVFDAVHRSLLVKFPTASQQIMAEVNRGFRIKKIQLVLPFRAVEFWPEYYREPAGLSFLGSLWKDTPPRWHAAGSFLRKPWANDPTYGPTFNANINGVSHWAKFGAQNTASDRYPSAYTVEVSSLAPSGQMDLTNAIASESSELGATLPDRLTVINNQGLVIRKVETYDFLYWQGGYEWGIATGQRGVIIHTPQLIVEFEAVAVPDPSAPKPPLDLPAEIARVQSSGSGGTPTALLPTQAQFDALASQFGFVQPAWMPGWQWQRVQDLKAMPTVNGAVEDVPMEFPTSLAGYATWMDSMLSVQPRRWAGFDAPKKAALYLRNQTALPEPVKDHWKLYWSAWLMPERPWQNADGSYNFVQAVTQVPQGRDYYNLTHDWRGNASLYRTYVHEMGPQDFNYFATAAVLLGGSIIDSPALMAEGRKGVEDWPLRHWTWRDGSTQESIDHYYFAITLSAQKAFADYGPTSYDRLLGQLTLTKCVEELASHYHPGLRRFVSLSGRTGPGYVLGNQDGLQHIMHTLSPSGAITDLGQTNVGGIDVIGHDFLPSAVAALTLDGPWAPEWYANIVDGKALPFQSKLIGEGVLKTSYLGHHYGMASGIGAWGAIPFLAQWRRTNAQAASMRDIGTLLLRYGIDRTDFLSTGNNGIVGNQGGYFQSLQHQNKVLVLSSPTNQLVTDNARPVPASITSLQTSLGFYNFELSPGWQLYVDGQLVTSFPRSIQNTQRITIQDGVTYIGIVPLPGTNLGRTEEVTISTDSVLTNLQGGGAAKEALRIDAYNLKSATPIATSSLTQIDGAWGGYAIELGDVTEYASFDAFQSHIAAAQVSASASGNIVNVQYVSGGDTLLADYNTDGGGSFTNAQANGQNVWLPEGIVRDTDVSTQGNTGRLTKSGATLLTDPKIMSYLQVEPVSGTYLGVNGSIELSRFVLQVPGGAAVRSEGKVTFFRAAIRPTENKLWIDCGARDGGAIPGHAVVVSGLSANPTVLLNGGPLPANQMLTLPTSAGPIYVIPLSGQLDATITQDYANTDSNGLPDAWENKWFNQLGVNPQGDNDGDGVNNAFEFAGGTNPRMDDAWIARYLGGLDDSAFQDPGGIGRTLVQSFEAAGASPWPVAAVPGGLRAWFRADMGISMNPDYYNQLIQWTDISGTGFHVTHTPGVTAPFLQGVMNGKPSVYFQGGWTQLKTATAVDVRAGSNDLTLFVVAKLAAAQGDKANLVYLGDGYGGYLPCGLRANSLNQVSLGLSWDWGATINATPERVQVISAVKSGATSSGYLNGAFTETRTMPAQIASPIGTMALGNGSSPYYGYNGEIAEVLVYSRALTETERRLVEQQLMSKYVAADSDNDGLPDTWELQQLGSLSHGANEDPGGVGRNLLQSHQQTLSPWPVASVANGMRAWFRADLGVTKDGGNKVTQVADLSGNGFHMLSTNPAFQPDWADNAMNGKAALTFAGNKALGTAITSDVRGGSNDLTIVVVAKPGAPQGIKANLVYLGDEYGGYLPFGLQANAANQISMGFGWEWGASINATAGMVQVVSAVKNGPTSEGYVNGRRADTRTMPEEIISALGKMMIGDGYAGEIAEVLVYNRALTETERQLLEQQLMDKYVAADSDNDGLPDAWELKYFGAIVYGASADPGVVGRTLLQSYQLDANPWPTAAVPGGLRAWHRADVGCIKDANNLISHWADLSGNGFNVVQPLGSAQPQWVESAMNGHPTVKFDPSKNLNTTLPVDLPGDSNDMTVITVIKPDAVQPGYSTILEFGGSLRIAQQGGENNLYRLIWLNAAGDRTYYSPAATISAEYVGVLSEVKSGTSASTYLNGASLGTNTVEAGMLTPQDTFSIGRYYNGQIAEVLTYNRALTETERQAIEQQLLAKYVAADSDNDGLPDAWELNYLGVLTYGAGADPGGVGRTLLQSQQGGLNPWPVATVSTGLRAWYRADLGAIRDGANKVSQLTDLSGTGFHVTERSIASRQPTWVANAMNGKPALQLGRLATRLPVDVYAGSNDLTVIAAIVPEAPQSPYATIVSLDAWGGFRLGKGGGGGVNEVALMWTTTAQSGNAATPQTILSTGRPLILTGSKAGTRGTIYVDGATVNGQEVAEPLFMPTGPLTVGSGTFAGYVAEVLVYNRALTDTERRQVELTLAVKYDDSDNDGLPDAWELKWAGKLTTLSDPNADPDQDGITNIQAYLNGASPFAGFNNFDFEQGWAGWTGGSGNMVGGIQGGKAYSSVGYYSHTLTSLPFTMPAGVTAFSVQIAGNQPIYSWQHSYIAVVDATTGAGISQLTRTRPSGWDWEPCSTTISLSTPTVVHLKIVQADASSHYFFYDDIRLDTLSATFSNFDFEQGWTGWTAVGYGAQIDSFVSDGKLPVQGTKAYQSAGGSSTLSSTEKARINHLYSGTFLVPAGQKLLTGQVFGGDANSRVALVNATTGVVLAQLGRFDSGPSWEKCYATFKLTTDTRAYLRVIDASSATHIAVDDLRITDYVFSNFDFEQGWAGWTGGSGNMVGGIQGGKAYSSVGYYSHTLTSLPFTMPAGVTVFSVQIAGNQPIYSWQHSYIAVVDATTGAVISQLTRTRPSGWDWEPCSTTISLSTPTVVHLKIVQADASSHYFFYDDIRLDALPTTFSNFDFEQGWTGWTAVGYGAQVDSFVSDGKLPVQGTKAYQSATGSGTLSSTEKARINHLYSGTFLIPAGQKLLTGQVFGGDANTRVALVNATTGAVLAQLGRFGSGSSWEKCYATFKLTADTRAYLRVIDASSTTHIAVDDLRITDYVFGNFDFEQGWAGWTGGSGKMVSGIQGGKAYSSEGYYSHTLTSLPFTMPAGVTVFSVQIAGTQPIYSWQHSYIAVVDTTTGAIISQLTRTRPSGWDWESCSTTISLSTPTVVHLKIVQADASSHYFFYDDIRLSTVATLRAPSITQQPESRSVFSGDSVTFTATVDGYPTPNLQWMHNGIPITGATMPTLTLSNVQASDAGGYTLVAVNQVGTATSTTATLTVTNTLPPGISQQPQSQTVAAGSSATFSVQATGTGPLSYQWQRNGVDLAGATGSTLALANVQFANAGTYRVVVANSAGSVTSDPATLTLAFSISALSPPSVMAGNGDFTLQVEGSGFLSGDVVLWNGTARPSTWVSNTVLTAAISAADVTGASGDIGTALVTVRHSGGESTNAAAFSILTLNVTAVATEVAAVSAQATVSTAPTAAGDAGITASLVNNTAGSSDAAIAIASYDTNSTSVPYFDVGGNFVDVQVTGADLTDVVTSFFYYPSTLTGSQETDSSLLYFTGSSWQPVFSSGGLVPAKNLTDNLDATVSGGRFTVVFDNTSTPKVTELTGTIFTVSLPDIEPPVIEVPADQVLEATGPAGAVADYSATAFDDLSGQVPVTFSPPSGSTFPLGTTTVTASATDGAGNNAAETFTITVRDTTPPVIIAPEDQVLEATSAAGAIATFAGSATDIVDGSVPVSFSPASGSTFALGTTTVTATTTDAAGNSSSSTFTITVRDTTPPVITVPADQILEATSAAGAIATFSSTATDLVDGNVAVSFSPVSGSTLALGVTTVTATATDTAGNSSSSMFTITVRDTTPPVITAPASQVLEANSAAGAIATFSGTASDIVDGNIAVSFSPVSGSTLALGVTTVTVTATDAAGNSSSSTFTITVRDTTPPVIAQIENMVVEATGPGGATVTFPASATDIVDGTVTVHASPASGSTFALGITTVTATASDAAGNSSAKTFTITVRDTTAPMFTSLTPSITNLWPANHKMVAISVTAVTSDTVSAVTTKIISVTSSEPDNGLGDGDTANDIEITGPMTLNLRAERAGGGSGRIYTITVEAKDAAGNRTTRTTTVTVAKP